MLILSRKVDQRIRIGDDVVVSVLEIDRDHVKIGIVAPKNIRVYRHEIYEAIQTENRAAVLSDMSAIDTIGDDHLPDAEDADKESDSRG